MELFLAFFVNSRNIFVTLFALGFVVFIHELGHMLAARRAGVGVLEFAVGMGPKVYSRLVNETLYSFRLFPFGGFVKLAGLDDDTDECDPEINFRHKGLWERFLTIFAGAGMNIVLGFLIFVIMFSVVGVPTPTTVLSDVVDGLPAQKVGLRVGDTLLSVNGKLIEDTVKDAIFPINESLGSSVSLSVLRDGQTMKIEVLPIGLKESPKRGVIGIRFKEEVMRTNPLKALWMGLDRTGYTVKHVFWSLSYIFSSKASLGDVAGPIGIIQLASFELDRSILNFFNIMAIISISLGVMNLLPFPVLDGGHLLFLLLEWFRGKPISRKWENYFQQAGALILISLMVFVIFNDIVNWQDRVSILKDSLGR